MRHPRVLDWERRLKQIFDRIDDEMENRYGHRWPLHPARPHRGAAASVEQDGLFTIGAGFTPGFGSGLGAGYVVEVRMATLARVPASVREIIEKEVVERLREELPSAFPGRDLRVERDGPVFKIHGDLSLGRAGEP